MQDHRVDDQILNLIQAEKIQEQEELQTLLKERGFDISQATLSRRLKKLKVAKVAGIYQRADFMQSNVPPVLNLQVSEFGLIVLHTYPGNANSLAYYLDQKYVNLSQNQGKASGILGIIAGDDTLFLSVKSPSDLPHVLILLQKEFPYLQIS